MELSDYPGIIWDKAGRLLANREINMPGRDRRATTFLKCLEELDQLQASVFRVGLGFRCSVVGIHGTFMLGADGEWEVDL